MSDDKQNTVRPEALEGQVAQRVGASTSPASTDREAPKPKSGLANLLVDYGPILVFFLTYKYFAPDEPNPIQNVVAVVWGTGAFMIAAVAALLYSKFKLGKISPMLKLSTGLIVFFGGLTVILRDPVFVQMKPTLIYAGFGIALLVGVWRGHALLKYLLEAAFEGLDAEGWRKLSLRWGVFFLVLAVTNEVLRLQFDFETWLGAKLWLFLPATFLFTFAQVPMLLKHGLAVEEDAVKDKPHTGE